MRAFPLIAAILLTACTLKPEEKANREIKRHLQSTLNDASSYQPVETTMDSFIVRYLDTREGLELMRKADSLNLTFDGRMSSRILYDSAFKMDEKIKPVFYGWKAYHSFRAKNGFGAVMLYLDSFYFDKNYKLIDRDTITLH